MKKKALILTWSGYQDHELVYPYYRLLGEEFEVFIVADQKDERGRVFGILGLNMPCHLLYKDFYKDTDDWMNKTDLLVLPGGVKSLEKLRQETKVTRFINQWNKNNKIITSICHGAQLLISSKITNGKNISGYYSLQDDINNSGANYINEPYVVDGNIISSPHYDHMGLWMEQTLKIYYNHYKN